MFISKYSTYVSISVAPDYVSLHVAEGVCLMQDRCHDRQDEYGEVHREHGTLALLRL